MSEGNQGRGPERRTPVSEDDRPTSEMPPIAGPAADGRGASDGRPASDGRSAPAGPTPPGPGPSGARAGGAPGAPRAAGPQPSASGWTPPPMSQRQPMQPGRLPARPQQGPGPSSPAPAAGGSRPGDRPAAGTPAAPAQRSAALSLPKPAPTRPQTQPDGPAEKASRTTDGASGPETPPVPFWRRISDVLGIERKPTSAPSAGSSTDASPVPVPSAVATATATASSVQPAGRPQNGVTGPYSSPRTSQPAPNVRPAPSQGGATAVVPAAGAQVGGVDTLTGASPRPASAPVRRTRKARLRLSRLDPWSVMKTAFLFSIAAGIMLVIAVYAIWAVLSASGLFASINEIVASVVSTPGDTTPFQLEDYISTQRVTGAAAVIAAVDVLLITALATLGSFLYNLAATMLGGLEITLAED